MADSLHTPGKLMMFGEYAVLAGSRALAIPLPGFFGYWQSTPDGQPDNRLVQWYLWLLQQADLGRLKWFMDLQAMGSFFYEGGHFVSNIPTGYGLGSSGALVAAAAHRWSVNPPTDPLVLMDGLAAMETYFHGQSSGLDPLVSYLHQAVLIREDRSIEVCPIPAFPPHLFLLDSGIPRNTAPLVDAFRSRLKDESFHKNLQETLLPLNLQAIVAVLKGDSTALGQAFRLISQYQLATFQGMIPSQLIPWWQGPGYHLKLCGAGGGGYFLGFSEDGSLPDIPFQCVSLSTIIQPGKTTPM